MTAGRTAALSLVALGAGIAIALMDSSPGWDSSGITAGLLVLGAGGTTVLARGRMPWLWGALIGLPTPILEIARTGDTGSILALAFAAVGAAIGWAIARGLTDPA